MPSLPAEFPSVPLLLLVCDPLLPSALTPHLVAVVPLGLSILALSIPIQVEGSLLYTNESLKKVIQKKTQYFQYAGVRRKHGGLKIGLSFRRKKRKVPKQSLGSPGSDLAGKV